MSNYKCLCELLKDNDLDLEHLIMYYVSYIFIFYEINILDEELKNKIKDIQAYIDGKIGE